MTLKYARYWRAAGWFLCALTLLGAVAPVDDSSMLFFSLFPYLSDQSMHAFAFFALTIWFAGAYETRSYLPLAAALLAFGGGIELIQSGLTHRSAEMMDLLADGLGVTAGFAVALAGLGRWCQWVESRLLRTSDGR